MLHSMELVQIKMLIFVKKINVSVFFFSITEISKGTVEMRFAIQI